MTESTGESIGRAEGEEGEIKQPNSGHKHNKIGNRTLLHFLLDLFFVLAAWFYQTPFFKTGAGGDYAALDIVVAQCLKIFPIEDPARDLDRPNCLAFYPHMLVHRNEIEALKAELAEENNPLKKGGKAIGGMKVLGSAFKDTAVVGRKVMGLNLQDLTIVPRFLMTVGSLLFVVGVLCSVYYRAVGLVVILLGLVTSNLTPDVQFYGVLGIALVQAALREDQDGLWGNYYRRAKEETIVAYQRLKDWWGTHPRRVKLSLPNLVKPNVTKPSRPSRSDLVATPQQANVQQLHRDSVSSTSPSTQGDGPAVTVN